MVYFILGGLAFVGVLANLSFVGYWLQPDWGLAILLAVLLSQRQTWYWVLPMIGLHDLLLFWSPWVTLPFAALSALLLAYADIKLAPGQPQRWLSLCLAMLPLLFAGVGVVVWLLTLTLSTWVWSSLSTQRERAYVEPA